MTTPSTREISRQAVRQQISAAAEQLVRDRGYDATTVDDIAHAAGISQRTFFRYFRTKDDVLLDGDFRTGEALVATLSDRPADEAPWTSLRTVLQLAIETLVDESHQARVEVFRQAVETSPTLLASYLGRLEQLQQTMGDLLITRQPGSTTDAIALRALVGAAFACLNAVMIHDPTGGLSPAERVSLLHTTMDAVRPASHDLGGAGT